MHCRAAGPLAIFRRDFRGGVERLLGPPGLARRTFAEKLFAVAVAVGPGGVEEIAAEIDGALERIERLGVFRAGPAGDAPHAVANFTDVPSGLAKAAIVHGGVLLVRAGTIIATAEQG